ncbi:putative ribonuclease H-like domain-containing protein, partial [Tanacetum coccineum]
RQKARENTDAPIIEDWVSDDEEEVESIPKEEKKTVVPTATKKESVKTVKASRRSVSFDHIQYNCPNAYKHMVPRAVLMKTGLKTVKNAKPLSTVRSVNTARPFSTARSVNTVRPYNTAHPKSTVPCASPKTHFQIQAQSTVQRPFYKRAKGDFNAVKPSGTACWGWRPIKGLRSSNSQLKEKGFVDSGCSRHMSGNIAHLSDFKEFDGGYVTFGGGANGGRITGKDSECLVLSPNFKMPDESQILLKIPRQNNIGQPQQNGVAERKNRTLIEAARTMLADSKLPTTFWAEAVSTACYVQNRSNSVSKPHIRLLMNTWNVPSPSVQYKNDDNFYSELGSLCHFMKERLTRTYIQAFFALFLISRRTKEVSKALMILLGLIGTKWVVETRKNEKGKLVVRNKARLVCSRLYSKKKKEGFEDPDILIKFIKGESTIWTSSSTQSFHKAHLLVQNSVDDIHLLDLAKTELGMSFEKLMKDQFQMSIYGTTYFLSFLGCNPGLSLAMIVTEEEGNVKIHAPVDGHSLSILEGYALDSDKLTFQKISQIKVGKARRTFQDCSFSTEVGGDDSPNREEQEGKWKVSDEISTAGKKKDTASEEVPPVSTAEVHISTAGRTATYSRRSAEKRKDKGNREKGKKLSMNHIRISQRKKSIPRKTTRKRQKLEVETEKEELKTFLDIVPREEAPIDIESLSTKFPIVDWKTIVLTET